MLNPRKFSFGGTSAIVTSMGLVIGLGAAKAETSTIVSGLLIVGLADNMTDSLSIHMYQEAEKLEGRAAFRTILTNFVARVLVAVSFAIIVLALPESYAGIVALAWGVSPVPEVSKHLGVAVLVIAASRLIGSWITHHVY